MAAGAEASAAAATPPALVVEALVDLGALAPVFRDGGGDLSAALVGSRGEVLWSRQMTPEEERALSESAAVRGFVRRPLG